MSAIPANHVLGLEFNWHGKKRECINFPSALYTYLSAGCRLCDKGRGGGGGGTPVIQTSRPLEIGGGVRAPKSIFRPFGPQFGVTGSATGLCLSMLAFNFLCVACITQRHYPCRS